jgi:hypothetical protein
MKRTGYQNGRAHSLANNVPKFLRRAYRVLTTSRSGPQIFT